MSKKKPPPKEQPSDATSPVVPLIFEASLRSDGSVVRGRQISQTEAEGQRKSGKDVVICGPSLSANRRLAGIIEQSANGSAKRCPPHATAGPAALPHWQPDPRPPQGHTFYETPRRKAV
jgi:hypothetical protein